MWNCRLYTLSMKKEYSNRKMDTETAHVSAQGQQFFFPKENPPITIIADSLEEAVEKLKAVKNKKL